MNKQGSINIWNIAAEMGKAVILTLWLIGDVTIYLPSSSHHGGDKTNC